VLWNDTRGVRSTVGETVTTVVRVLGQASPRPEGKPTKPAARAGAQGAFIEVSGELGCSYQ
jgi:hypothetical protein